MICHDEIERAANLPDQTRSGLKTFCSMSIQAKY